MDLRLSGRGGFKIMWGRVEVSSFKINVGWGGAGQVAGTCDFMWIQT